MPNSPERPRRITLVRNGPVLVEGPVEVTGDDGEVWVSDRFTVALCTCRRSRRYPWCDTSHRRPTGQTHTGESRSATRTQRHDGGDDR
ncbi:CDGSH iron-sulfur domain-containing protein [Streptomyces catenulae]|uniref:CDGSH iron-sulfur domain-containing protein n=1 Tax=Streptomyces catenulae TaxID=66875 RepID=A0ABV2YSW4_9ACTN|nr:CDGSH iron-sulfur domain-containing protein [Streptomyces catenulae]